MAGDPGFPMSGGQLLYKSPAGVTGHIMLLCMVLMYTTAKQTQRNKSFESFWYTHHLAFVMLGSLMFHGIGCIVKDQDGVCRGYRSYQYLLIGYILYIIERGIRFYRAGLETRLVKAIQHPAGVVELQIQKPSFKYKPGQYMFINVPELSEYQWHPFTITSSPFEDYVSVHIRQAGDWTRALATRMGVEKEGKGDSGRGRQAAGGPSNKSRAEKSTELIDDRGEEIHVRAGFSMPTVRIDGPFGAPTEDVFDHEIVVLVGSGIGVTPFASILRDIWYRANNNMTLKTKRIEFYWVCRDLASLKWFQSLLATIEGSMLNVQLKIHIYCTAVMKPDQHHNIALHMNDDFSGGDTITGLRALTNFGRPNFGAIFSELRQGITNGTYMPGATQELMVDVAVFFCGPGAMAKSLRKESRLQSKNGVKFSFRKEHF
jgi:NADPH oxidase